MTGVVAADVKTYTEGKTIPPLFAVNFWYFIYIYITSFNNSIVSFGITRNFQILCLSFVVSAEFHSRTQALNGQCVGLQLIATCV